MLYIMIIIASPVSTTMNTLYSREFRLTEPTKIVTCQQHFTSDACILSIQLKFENSSFNKVIPYITVVNRLNLVIHCDTGSELCNNTLYKRINKVDPL